MINFSLKFHAYYRIQPDAYHGRSRRPCRTSDGFVCVMIYSDRHWRSFFKALGREDGFDRDPRYRSMTTRTEHIADLYRELAELLGTRSTADWLDLFDSAEIPAMPLHNPDSLVADAHLAATGFFSFEDHPSENRSCKHLN